MDEFGRVPAPFDRGCIVVSDVFDAKECNDLIGKMKQDPLKIDTTTSADVLRIVERTSLNDSDLAKYLFDRVSKFCPQSWHVEDEDLHLGPFAQGDWVISEVDPRIQVYRYETGGVFGKHRDGPTYYSINKRSLFTVLIYLNDDYSGGNTTVFTDDENHSFKVPNAQGSIFAMLQRILHEGSTVTSGIKWAMRCDVIYERASENPAQSIQHLTKQEQAKRWFDLASRVELSGGPIESVAYYQKAYKLDPNLEEQ
eukprot:TRINITY_DN5792_c0_g1_i1.p1 TRINITY_DN5792_c0_g1~~TRINITY_DN5792_c0_g1_i1.p1  ORF type:complete len:254 (+),score=48.78 TRINITY_DN5792_c0_g1_i1:60-821(+)